jgi:hypothetical protein
LEPIDEILRESGQQRVAIVKLGKDESTDKSFSCFSREKVANRTYLTQFYIGTSTNISNLLFEREGRVKGDSKTADRRGEWNCDIAYVQRSGQGRMVEKFLEKTIIYILCV